MQTRLRLRARPSKQCCTESGWHPQLHRGFGFEPMSGKGLGRAKTQARRSAVEWRSKTRNALGFSREAHVTMSSVGDARNSRKPCDSDTSGARLTPCRLRYYVSMDRRTGRAPK